MIAILKQGATPQQTNNLVSWLKAMGLDVHISQGTQVTILGLIGDTSRVDMELLSSLEIVETVKRVSEPFKQANRKFHPQDTIIQVGNARIGGGYFAMIAGPCSVESEEQIMKHSTIASAKVKIIILNKNQNKHVFASQIQKFFFGLNFGKFTRISHFQNNYCLSLKSSPATPMSSLA